MARMHRRAFLALAGTGAAFRPAPLWPSVDVPASILLPGPCADLVPLVDPENDEYPAEAHGRRVEKTLASTLLEGRLPVAPGLSAPSPMPAMHEPSGDAMIGRYGAEAVSVVDGFRDWVRALGEVQRASFHALPHDIVRFEVSSSGRSGLEHRVGHWRMEWQDDALHGFEPLDETLVQSKAPLFADVTGELFSSIPSLEHQLAKGIPYWRSRLDPATGIDVYGNQGIAVGDIDGDGWDEIYVCQPGGLPNRLYSRKPDGQWLDTTDEAGISVLDNTAQALFLDLRNSGLQDLVVLTSGGPLLFLNDGDGRFTLRSDAFRFASGAQGTFAGMAAADYDRDGAIDIYLCSYVYFQSEDQYRYPVPYHDAHNGPPNFLFRNALGRDGSGCFEDVTEASGMGHNNDRYSFAAAWCDYDEDGWPELYVANDFGRNNLYKYEDGEFRDVASQAGVEDIGPGMSAAWFDYNRDGRLDLFVTNMWTPSGQRVSAEKGFGPVADGASKRAFHGHTKGNSLYRNRGDGAFDYAGDSEGVEVGRWAWSGDGFDFDLDGQPEILVTAGMMTHSPEQDLCSFFWRQVVAHSPATQRPAPAYEEGWNCLNQLVREEYSWNGSEPNLFYARRGGRYRDYSGVSGLDLAADSRAFAVTDFDGDGRPDLLLKSRLGPQVAAFRNDSTGERHGISVDLEGVASNRDAVGAIVRLETEDGVAAQVLSAGSGYMSQHSKRLHFGLGNHAEALSLSIRWPSGAEQRFQHLRAGFRYRIREGDDRYETVPHLARTESQQRATPIEGDNSQVLAPTWFVEPVPLPVKAAEGFLILTDGPMVGRAPAVPYKVVDLRQAPTDQLPAFTIFRRYLFDHRADLELPLTLLVDGRSRVHKIYPSIPTEADLKADLSLLRQSGRRPSGLPFAGQYLSRPSRNHFRMGAAFVHAGLPKMGLPFLRAAEGRQGGNFRASLAIGQIQMEAGDLEAAATHLERAQALRPDSPELWNNLGGLAMAREDHRTALQHFGRALELNPDLPYALINAAQTHTALGQAADAERLLRRALELEPDDPEAANKLGLVLAKQGQLEEARGLFERAIEHRRDYAEAINNLAVLYLQSRQVGDAMAALRYGIEQVPDFDTFYMNLARIHVERGDVPRARQVMQSLLDRKPGHPDATRVLAQLALR